MRWALLQAAQRLFARLQAAPGRRGRPSAEAAADLSQALKQSGGGSVTHARLS